MKADNTATALSIVFFTSVTFFVWLLMKLPDVSMRISWLTQATFLFVIGIALAVGISFVFKSNNSLLKNE